MSPSDASRPQLTASRASASDDARGGLAERNTIAARELMAEARRIAQGQVRVPPPEKPIAKIAALLGSAVVVYGLMSMTPRPMDIFSDVWQRVLYLPIIAAAVMFGFRVGFAMALGVAALCLCHIKWYWGGDFFGENLARSIEVFLLVVVGGLTGYLSDMLQLEKQRAIQAGQHLDRACRLLLQTSLDLAKSMEKLRESTFEAMSMQQQLLRADRLAALGTMTAGLAHEIRNPLGSIKGTAEILADRLGGDEVAKEFLDILLKETDRLNAVLTNFLRFARGSHSWSGKDVCDAVSAVSEVVELLERIGRKRGVAIEWKRPDGPIYAAIPGGSLRQVVFNLLRNAIQAMEESDGERQVWIDIHACEETDRVCLDVADSGPGVPERLRDKIFDPFFTTKEQGTGLGLAISARIVSEARGTLALLPNDLSRYGGAHFALKLRQATQAEAAASSSGFPGAPAPAIPTDAGRGGIPDDWADVRPSDSGKAAEAGA